MKLLSFSFARAKLISFDIRLLFLAATLNCSLDLSISSFALALILLILDLTNASFCICEIWALFTFLGSTFLEIVLFIAVAASLKDSTFFAATNFCC